MLGATCESLKQLHLPAGTITLMQVVKADAKAKKEAQAKMTPEEKKAANAAKVKQEKESAKDPANKP